MIDTVSSKVVSLSEANQSGSAKGISADGKSGNSDFMDTFMQMCSESAENTASGTENPSDENSIDGSNQIPVDIMCMNAMMMYNIPINQINAEVMLNTDIPDIAEINVPVNQNTAEVQNETNVPELNIPASQNTAEVQNEINVPELNIPASQNITDNAGVIPETDNNDTENNAVNQNQAETVPVAVSNDSQRAVESADRSFEKVNAEINDTLERISDSVQRVNRQSIQNTLDISTGGVQNTIQDIIQDEDVQQNVNNAVHSADDVPAESTYADADIPEISSAQSQYEQNIQSGAESIITDNTQQINQSNQIADNNSRIKNNIADNNNQIPQADSQVISAVQMQNNEALVQNNADIVSDIVTGGENIDASLELSGVTQNKSILQTDNGNLSVLSNSASINQTAKNEPQTSYSDSGNQQQYDGENSDTAYQNPLVQEQKIQSDFYNNVNEVKNFLKNNVSENTETGKTDIDSLQKSAETINIADLQTAFKNFEMTDSVNSSVPTADIYKPSEIMNQTLDGIVKNMHGDENEFTVKLNPEGLGEITVTILKNDTSSILSLSVSNAKTAEILSGDINSLQEALKHLNIEVADVQVEKSEQSSQYNGYEEQFQKNNSQQQKNSNKHNSLLMENEDDSSADDDYLESEVLSYI